MNRVSNRRVVALALAVLVTAGLSTRATATRADELPIAVQSARLENGLRVVLLPERTTPTVAVAVYYDVGSRVEERGRSGFAHLFEHMMFEGSANVGDGEHFRLVSLYGGDFNGTTSEDRTNYYETLPSNALELGLFLEADRMRSLSVTQENFENQRETVMEERRESYENQPYALSLLRRDEVAYGDYWPYAHSVIGDMADLRRADVQLVRAFHARYYLPNNAVVAISGDFDATAALELVRRHFGAITRHDVPAWVDPGMRPQERERRDRVDDPHAELPAFHVAYHIPARRTPDHYALEVLAAILGDGQSSRLYRDLVRTREVASSIEVVAEGRRGPDLFTIFCVLSAGRRAEDVRPLIYESIESIARSGVPGRELQKARNRIRARYVLDSQSNLQRALRSAEYEMYDGNARLFRTELDRYVAVTVADVQRVAAQYFSPANRTVIDVQLPSATRPAQGAATGGRP